MAGQGVIEYPFIGGERVASAGDGFFPAINPATGEVAASVVQTSAAQLDDAVATVAEAQCAWLELPASERGARLSAWARAVAAQAGDLAVLDTRDMGKAIKDSRSQVAEAPRTIEYWAGMADKIWGNLLPVRPGHISYTKREPIGILGVILPWNSPANQFAARVASALACGNGVVVKPSQYSPRSALRMAELTVEAGIPRGLIAVTPGDGEIGALVSAHAGISGISFTGSVSTGRRVAVAAAQTFKKVVLEMGGKSPAIVFADADLDEALLGTLWGVFSNAGQVCNAGTRLLVERSIAAEFVRRLLGLVGRVRVGDPMDENVQIGPVVCQVQYDRVRRYLDIGRAEATLACGGGRPAALPGEAGLFIEPTVFTNVDSSMRIAQEEIFGPVLSVLTFDDEDEALVIANDVEYGLAANVWTRDIGRMLRFAEQLEVGTVWGNSARVLHPALPIGGYKNSGLGTTSGDGAIDGNTRLRRVSIRYDMAVPAPGWRDL